MLWSILSAIFFFGLGLFFGILITDFKHYQRHSREESRKAHDEYVERERKRENEAKAQREKLGV
jgi:predicted histidine transporter YuiF (NhaC family)